MTRAAQAALVILLLLTAPACRGGGASGASASAERDQQSFVAVQPNSNSPTDALIARTQQELVANTADETLRVRLAQLFLQKVRENGDPTLYVKAEALLDDVEGRSKELPELYITKGSLSLAQHRFEDARRSGERALELAPGDQSAYSVVVDAYNELGEADKALEATQAMVDIRPSLTALARVSYARELRGDTSGAIETMRQAVSAGRRTGGENLAYVQVLLGDLLLSTGNVEEAERAYNDALGSFSSFAAAEAGLARVSVARGEFDAAAGRLAGVVKRQPFVEYAVAHGDALYAANRIAEAEEAYALVDVIAQLYRANGVDIDRELALFNADHRPDENAVEQARTALKGRSSAASHDVLAWALYRDGKFNEAYEESKESLALGTKNPQDRFHAAAIAQAVGKTDEAREHMTIVTEGNPYFSAFLLPEVRTLAQTTARPFRKPAGL